jgi:hypothetical protein
MPFDAAGFPKKDGAYPTEPTPVERWLRYVVAVLFILVALVVPAWVVAWSLWGMSHDIWHL